MKGQIFWQQMPKMGLKKKKKSGEEKEHGENRKIHLSMEMDVLQKPLRVYACLFRPVITCLQECIHEQEFA